MEPKTKASASLIRIARAGLKKNLAERLSGGVGSGSLNTGDYARARPANQQLGPVSLGLACSD
jgi:hypothetical protein